MNVDFGLSSILLFCKQKKERELKKTFKSKICWPSVFQYCYRRFSRSKSEGSSKPKSTLASKFQWTSVLPQNRSRRPNRNRRSLKFTPQGSFRTTHSSHGVLGQKLGFNKMSQGNRVQGIDV